MRRIIHISLVISTCFLTTMGINAAAYHDNSDPEPAFRLITAEVLKAIQEKNFAPEKKAQLNRFLKLTEKLL